MDPWDQLFRSVVSFLHLTAAREDAATHEIAEATILKLDSFISVLSAIQQSILDGTQRDVDLQDLAQDLQQLLNNLNNSNKKSLGRPQSGNQSSTYMQYGHTRTASEERSARASQVHCAQRADYLPPELKFTWTKIGAMFGVSRKTLYYIRQLLGVSEEDGQHFTQIPDTDLQEQVRAIKVIMPDAGQSMVRRTLRVRGIHVPISCVQECVSVVDPVNTAMRWASPIH